MRYIRAIAVLTALVAALAALPGLVGAAPALTIAPTSGPPETRFVATLAGFTPGEKIMLQLVAETQPPLTLNIPAVTITADGTYALTINALVLLPGSYTLAALREATVVASARFTVTPPGSPVPTPPSTGSGGYLPGLPNTGGGGAGPASPIPVFLLLLGIPGLLAMLALMTHRRKALAAIPRAVPVADDDGGEEC